jgi:hydroxymethylglutaryl-CoA lyase
VTKSVTVYEVGPRDGLQNEPVILPTEAKIEFIHGLVDAGFKDIEVTSFVRPRWVPQLADALDVVRHLPKAEDVTFWGLVPNRVGMERALESGINGIATFMSASEAHNKRNINRSIRESLAAQKEVISTAVAEGLRVRCYLSVVFGCPYDGDIPVEQVVRLGHELLEAGAETLALGDTIGIANPDQVTNVVRALADAGIGPEKLSLHMHDTRGSALANVLAGLQAGVRIVDASISGLGGCPYAEGAAGNLATEDLVNMLDGMGWRTGVDLISSAEVGMEVERSLGRELPGRYHRYYSGTSNTANVCTAS